ncbi:PocR ligand-binding domain-containing protein [Clostridium grantii]|uniref:Helix-turn-helix domain-containing protein n=1 Tax=Clostridium grantii DSM 8605 TaxID=1121316 RepID=A0A1M5T3M8_9CLOT|nr:PocR ligand-binding domain-containing protein [Clostridium grantii]SHH45369.1 Helix-turn-helix domain-containing protein [Clostridium grantii DSM 8605]
MEGLFDTNGDLNINIIKETLDTFYYSTNIPVFAINDKGIKIATSKENCKFCGVFNNLVDNKYLCNKIHLDNSINSINWGESYIFNCPALLTHFSAPIVYEGEFKGALIAGPILLSEYDDLIVDDIIYKYDIPISEKSNLQELIKKTTIVSPERTTYLSKLLFILCANLLDEEKFKLREKNILLHQQAKIGETIHSIKTENTTEVYPYQKEKDLVTKVKLGDEVGAKKILNELLGHVFFSSGGNKEIIKTRILELFSVLSRAAVQGGASLDTIFGINYKFISKLSKLDSIEELSYWTLNILDRFTENVFNLSNANNSEIMKTSLNYINNHYMENLSLDDMANYVHLNSSYFSTLFKSHIGEGFSDYLNKVRISEAKKFLKETEYSLLEISNLVGYESQSYFTKVFKKITGRTPKQYRSN